MSPTLFLVQTAARRGRAEAFNRWYSDQHLGDVLACNGAIAAQRFAVDRSFGGKLRPYLAIYEVEDAAAFDTDLAARRNTELMVMSDALHPDRVGTFYRPIKKCPAVMASNPILIQYLNFASTKGSEDLLLQKAQLLRNNLGGVVRPYLLDDFQSRPGWRLSCYTDHGTTPIEQCHSRHSRVERAIQLRYRIVHADDAKRDCDMSITARKRSFERLDGMLETKL